MNEKYTIEYKDKLNQNVLKNMIFNRLPILKDFGIKFIEKEKSILLLNEIYKKIDFNSQNNKNVLLIEKNEKINLYYNEIMEFRNKIFKIQNNTIKVYIDFINHIDQYIDFEEMSILKKYTLKNFKEKKGKLIFMLYIINS